MSDKLTDTKSSCCGKVRRGRPLQMKLAAREAAILRTTAQLLLERPFDEVTMAVIAGKAGMSKRTVYEHFKNREDLLTRAIINLSSTIFLPLSLEDLRRPLKERLSLLLRYNTPTGSGPNNLEFLRSIIAKAKSYPDLAQKLYATSRGALADFVRAEVLRAVGSGEIFLARHDLNMAVEMLLDMAFESPLTRLLHPCSQPQNQAEIERRRELAISIFLQGCAP
ncbi:TetR/AcrR family transcriptional regulator [Lentibacter sp. XHP0401]|uniref:TetR/AcrR family transcriptional regulator n=1 Tax=Lentibacter sp. XHP0401 TaxID=2984334 RepID=UPI0021E84A76|nr:TetR/AcrR family transcriptional regulator [Lentibacter sp. XHP0401]MCV2892867.1 TetR/AcrR family transcriptional regulator [Lentibacter sp. XHP0401]